MSQSEFDAGWEKRDTAARDKWALGATETPTEWSRTLLATPPDLRGVAVALDFTGNLNHRLDPVRVTRTYRRRRYGPDAAHAPGPDGGCPAGRPGRRPAGVDRLLASGPERLFAGEHVIPLLPDCTPALAGLPSYDVRVLSDGSGSGWHRPCGWGSAVYDRCIYKVWTRWGGLTRETVNAAEAMSLLDPLSELSARPRRGVLAVALVTNSQMSARPPRPWASRPAAGAGLWARGQALLRDGLALSPHHRPRNATPWRVFVDALSKRTQLQFTPPPMAITRQA